MTILKQNGWTSQPPLDRDLIPTTKERRMRVRWKMRSLVVSVPHDFLVPETQLCVLTVCSGENWVDGEIPRNSFRVLFFFTRIPIQPMTVREFSFRLLVTFLSSLRPLVLLRLFCLVSLLFSPRLLPVSLPSPGPLYSPSTLLPFLILPKP